MGGESREFIWVGAEGKICQLCDLFCSPFGELRRGIETRSDRCASDCQIIQTIQGELDPIDTSFQESDVTGKFLAQHQRGRILQVGSSDFDDPFEFFLLFRKGPF